MVPVGDQVILVPLVVLVVHPIDRDKHPSWPEGYRWAVHVGGQPIHDLEFCVNAGYQHHRRDAIQVGDMCAASVTQALRKFGTPAILQYMNLNEDPLPAGPESDRVHVLVGGGRR